MDILDKVSIIFIFLQVVGQRRNNAQPVVLALTWSLITILAVVVGA